MTKKKKKSHWENNWISIIEQLPPEGALLLTSMKIDPPDETERGNINQYSDGNWFHISKSGEIHWWRLFTPEDLWYFQDKAIGVFFNGLINNVYEKWNIKEIYGFDIEKLCSWANNRRLK